MNVLFCTQSLSLSPFLSVARHLKQGGHVAQVGFTVADSWAYLNWLEREPAFEREGWELLKEWEITTPPLPTPDPEVLRLAEERLGSPAGLWGAVVTDRRLLMGPDCTYTQDYRSRFNGDHLTAILQKGLESVRRLFDRLNPSIVVGFNCNTFLEYLVHLEARARGARSLILRPARVANCMSFGSTLRDPWPELVEATLRVQSTGQSPQLEEARRHLASVRDRRRKYEGVAPPSATPAQRKEVRGNPLSAAWRLWKTHRAFRASIAASDNHCPGILRPVLFKGVLNPLRARRVDRMLRPRYVSIGQMANRRFAFYPMHAEPEVSLLLTARPWLNQIEIIRMLALSLPADMTLVVKEHPWMVGKRTPAAYAKILDIPKVLMAAPEAEASDWAQAADLVTVLCSSVGLEAAIYRRPVLTLAKASFSTLPQEMVHHCADPTRLSHSIAWILANHRHDEAALEAYIAGVLETSVRLNFYTGLLGRGAAHREHDTDAADDIRRMAQYVLDCSRRPSPVIHAPDQAADW